MTGLGLNLLAVSVDPVSILLDVVVAIVVSALVAAVPVAWWWNVRRRARQLWPIQADRIAVVLATSTTTNTGKYLRSASGMGQVRALAVLVPSIYRAWKGRLDVSHVLLSEDVTNEWTRDMVVLGGTKNNQVSRQILEKYAQAAATNSSLPRVTQIGSTIAWEGMEYTADADQNAAITRDYGLVLRWTNPFDRRRTVILLAGASTFGTIAASMWFVGETQPDNAQQTRRLKNSKSFIALVGADVRRGHVAAPTLIHGATIA